MNRKVRVSPLKRILTILIAILLVCLIAAFAGVEPLSSYKNDLVNQLFNTENKDIKEETIGIIPFGTYGYETTSWITDRQIVVSITFYKNGTYMALNFRNLVEREEGYYNFDNMYLHLINDATREDTKYKYRYSDEFECLYIYFGHSDNPTSYFKR